MFRRSARFKTNSFQKHTKKNFYSQVITIESVWVRRQNIDKQLIGNEPEHDLDSHEMQTWRGTHGCRDCWDPQYILKGDLVTCLPE